MDAIQFSQLAQQDQALSPFLQQVAAEAAREVSPKGRDRSVTLTGMLCGIAAYALYRWLKNYFDHERGWQVAELRKQMEKEIGELVKKGFPPKEARATVIALSNTIAKSSPNDPAIKAALALVTAGADS